MKVAVQKNSSNFTKKNHHLPLVREAKSHNKSNSCSFELLSDPADANSQRFKMTILRLSGGEDVRTVLQWRQDIDKVLGGLNLTTPMAKVKIISTIISGTPQTTFEQKINSMCAAAMEAAITAVPPDATNPNAQSNAQQVIRVAGLNPHLDNLMVIHSIAHTVQEMMPKKVLARAKREVRRDMRKPSDMTIRDYYNHLQRINLLEVHNLPPFGRDQVFKPDEIIDIMIYGIPSPGSVRWIVKDSTPTLPMSQATQLASWNKSKQPKNSTLQRSPTTMAMATLRRRTLPLAAPRNV